MSERPTQAEIDEANASHAQEELEREWREEFEKAFIHFDAAEYWNEELQDYEERDCSVAWRYYKAAKHSSQAQLNKLHGHIFSDRNYTAMLAKIAEKDRKIAELERECNHLANLHVKVTDELTRQNAEQAKLLAMMREALKEADDFYHFVELGYIGQIDLKHKLLKALSATSETVELYLDEVRAEARDAALEEALQICFGYFSVEGVAQKCASDIQALKGKV